VVPARGGDAEPVALPADIVRWKIIDVTWAPGGDRITFVARAAAGLSTSSIWSVRPDGTDPVRVTRGTSFDRNPVWSRDGRGIYLVSDRGGSPDLWYLSVDAAGRPRGDPVTLTVGAGVGSFALSDDGRHIAYSKQTVRSNIWSMPLTDRVITMDDARPVISENHFIELLAVSPDGKRLAFDSDRSGNADIWTIGVDGKGVEQVTSDPAHDWAPRWSPDGRSIGYHSLRSGNRDLWVQPVQGGTAVQLTHHAAQDWTISWSPDGKTIVFGSGRSGAVQLWRMPATGGDATRLTTIGAVWWYPVWSPDGKSVAFSSDTSV
jgi:TolB protein